MLRTSALLIVFALAAASAQAQTPAHHGATNLLLNQPTATTPATPGATAATPGGSAKSAPATGAVAGQFSTEQAAKAHCPADTVVWVNLGGSKAYHTSGDRFYGKTRHGAYMCQKEAEQAGFHAPGHRSRKAVAKTTAPKSQ